MSMMAMATLGCAGQYPLDRDMVGVVTTVCAGHEAGRPLLCLRLVKHGLYFPVFGIRTLRVGFSRFLCL